jgi:branched-chain amino acid transport system substrate-binding protein
MKTYHKWIIGLVALVVIIGLIAINKKQSPVSSETIKIGAALALTGDAAEWGEQSLNGAKLAVSEINAKGGINGKQLELIVEDTKSTSKDSVSAVSKLQNVDGARALLVSWLDVYQGAESVLKDDAYIISPDSGIEAVNGETVKPRVYSTWYRTGPKSELAVKHMAENGVKTLYLIAENDSYYTGALNFMKVAAAKYGVEIVGTDQPTSADSLKSIMIKVKDKSPDAVFFAFYDEAKNYEFLSKRKSFLGDSVKVYSDEFTRQNYQNETFPKGSFDGIYFYSPQSPEKKFGELYKATYNSDPVFGASTAYDAVYMIAEVSKKTPENIDAFMRSTTFDTASYGKVIFDAIGGVQSKENYFEIKQVVDGKIK